MRRAVGPLAVGAGITGLGLFFALGAWTIAGDALYSAVGPRAYPTLIGAGLVILGVSFLRAARRGLEFPAAAIPPERGAIPWILAGLVLATALVTRLGFPVATSVLFVFAARGFGSRRWARNLLYGAVLSVVVYLVFSRGLGISLPGGPLDRS